jgi:hypothetical protein
MPQHNVHRGWLNSNKGCVTLWPCHFRKKSILRQKKKNYGNSNISPCKNIIFKKSSKRKQNPSKTSYNSITNLKFQTQAKMLLNQALMHGNLVLMRVCFCGSMHWLWDIMRRNKHHQECFTACLDLQMKNDSSKILMSRFQKLVGTKHGRG